MNVGHRADQAFLGRIMKNSLPLLSKFESAPLNQWLSMPDTVILLGGPQSSRKQEWMQLLRKRYPKAVYVRATGPDLAFPLDFDQPLVIEDFQKLSRKTRKFILTLEIPLVICSSRPLYWEFWRHKRKIFRVFP